MVAIKNSTTVWRPPSCAVRTARAMMPQKHDVQMTAGLKSKIRNLRLDGPIPDLGFPIFVRFQNFPQHRVV